MLHLFSPSPMFICLLDRGHLERAFEPVGCDALIALGFAADLCLRIHPESLFFRHKFKARCQYHALCFLARSEPCYPAEPWNSPDVSFKDSERRPAIWTPPVVFCGLFPYLQLGVIEHRRIHCSCVPLRPSAFFVRVAHCNGLAVTRIDGEQKTSNQRQNSLSSSVETF